MGYHTVFLGIRYTSNIWDLAVDSAIRLHLRFARVSSARVFRMEERYEQIFAY